MLTKSGFSKSRSAHPTVLQRVGEVCTNEYTPALALSNVLVLKLNDETEALTRVTSLVQVVAITTSGYLKHTG